PDELASLYAQYMNVEPTPTSAGMGFKVPRQVRVQWLSARPDSERYLNEGADLVKRLEAAARAGLAMPESAGGPLLAALAATSYTEDLALLAEYERYLRRQPSWVWAGETSLHDSSWFNTRWYQPDIPREQRVERRPVLLFTLSQLLSNGAVGAPP